MGSRAASRSGGGKRRRRDAVASPREERASWPFVNAATLETWYGPALGLGYGEATTLGLSAVWRCITLLADAIAGRRWTEWRGTEELPPSRLVRRPAQSYTRRQWTWRVVATLALYNRAPLWMVGGVDDEGVPGSLLPIPPDAVQPREPFDELGIRPPTRYTVGREEVSAEELLIIRRAELPTIPPHHAALLYLARRVFGQAIAADAGAARYWESGGAPTTVLSTEQELTKAQGDAIAERWLEKRALGPDYPAVLGRGAKAMPYGADPTRESSTEARRELVADVARLFGLPTRLVNAPSGDSRTYATTEADSLDLIRYTLAGYRDPIADAISDLLPGDPILGRRVEIELEELNRPEQEARYRAWGSAIEAGWMTVDEVRAREGLPPMPLEDTTPAEPDPGPPAAVEAAAGQGAAAPGEADADSGAADSSAPGPSEEVLA